MKKINFLIRLLMIVFIAGSFVLQSNTALGGQPKANLDQGRNGPHNAPVNPVAWVNGNVNQSQAHMVEGYSVPYRIVMTDMPVGTAVDLTLEFDTRHSGKNALDFLTGYDNLDPHIVWGHPAEDIFPTFGYSQFNGVSPVSIPIVTPTNTPTAGFFTSFTGPKYMSIWGATIASTPFTYDFEQPLTGNVSSTRFTVHFTPTASTVILAWGGHIARAYDWGEGESAGGISGSPYHTRTIGWNLNNLGNQDRSTQAAVVLLEFDCEFTAPPVVCLNQSLTATAVHYHTYVTYNWSIINNNTGATPPTGTGQTFNMNAGATPGTFEVKLIASEPFSGTILTQTCTKVITADATAPVISGCPTGPVYLGCNPLTLPSCTTALALVTAYDSAEGHSITPTCQAGTVENTGCNYSQEFTLTAADSCGNSSECVVTYTWNVDDPGTLNCAQNHNEPACETQAQINTAFATWLATTTVTGGCNPVLTNNNTGAPSVCGGSTTVKFKVTYSCQDADSCTATFTVGNAPDLVVNCPAPVDLSACTGVSAITTAYNTWKAGFSVSGGCSPTSNIASIPALPANPGCGVDLSFTLKAYNGAGYCVDSAQCSSTFKVASAPDLVVNCPAAVDLPPCTSVSALTTAYNTWKAGFSVSGGCSPTSNIASIPPLPANPGCGVDLSFTLKAYNGAGYCVDSAKCTSTFKVETAPHVYANCPTPVNLPSCTSVSDITAAYNTWKAGFSVSGGCSPTSNIAGIPSLPSNPGCGVDLSFTLKAYNGAGYCVDSSQCTSTFKVASAPDLVVNCPGAVDLPACTSVAAITTAYNNWKAGFTVTGGCSPTDNKANIPALPTNPGCGVDLSFTLKAYNGVGYCIDSAKCTSTFKVQSAPDLVVNCPGAVDLPACTSVAAITTAYNNWKAGFTVSGGCSPTDNRASIPPLPTNPGCGVDLSFTLKAYNAVGYCIDSAKCTSTFKVASAPDLVATCPAPVDLAACTSVAAITAAYNTWKAGFIVSGGCSPTDNKANIPPLPTNPGCGVDLSFTLKAYNAVGYCIDSAKCTSTFKVASAPDLVVNCPGAVDLPACTSVAAITTAYNNWKAGFTVTGGCSPTDNRASIPPLPANPGCGVDLSFTLKAYNAVGYCIDSAKCTSTFKVASAPDLVATCPAPVDLPACTSVADITTAYNNWKAGFTVTGGCSPTDNRAGIPPLPGNPGCGVDLSFTLKAYNAVGFCIDSSKCTSTFKVEQETDLDAICSADPDLPSCTSAEDIEDAYNAWVAGFHYTGGCAGHVETNIGDVPALGDLTCGGQLSFTYQVENAEGYCEDSDECSTTFTVAADTTPPSITCPDPITVQCTSEVPQPDPSTVTATDACVPAPVVTWVSDIISDSTCPNRYLITRTYLATDACENTNTCTQVITVNDTTGPEWTSTPEDIEALCGEPVTLTYPTASDNCGATPAINCWRSDALLCSDDFPQGVTTVYFQAVDDCGNLSAVDSITVTLLSPIDCEEDITWTVNNGNPLFCGMVNNTLKLTFTDPGLVESVTWNDLPSGSSWSFETTSDPFTVKFDANSPDDYAIFSITIVDTNGCIKNCEKQIDCVPAAEYCTLTMGAWGEPGGSYCDTISQHDMLVNLLTPDGITVGLTAQNRSYYTGIGETGAGCVETVLPSGGPGQALAANYTCYSDAPDLIANTLFGQTLTLAINVRNSSFLWGVALVHEMIVADNAEDCGSAPDAEKFATITIPDNIIAYLNSNYGSATVGALLAFANDALGALYVPSQGTPSLGDITNALNAINVGFDNCKYTADLGGQNPTPSKTGGKVTEGLQSISINAYPNPFDGNLTVEVSFSQETEGSIDIYNMLGNKVGKLAKATFAENLKYSFTWRPSPAMPQGIYVIKVSTGSVSKQFRVSLIK